MENISSPSWYWLNFMYPDENYLLQDIGSGRAPDAPAFSCFLLWRWQVIGTFSFFMWQTACPKSCASGSWASAYVWKAPGSRRAAHVWKAPGIGIRAISNSLLDKKTVSEQIYKIHPVPAGRRNFFLFL